MSGTQSLSRLGVLVTRPADLVEVAEAWEIPLTEKTRPTVLALSR